MANDAPQPDRPATGPEFGAPYALLARRARIMLLLSLLLMTLPVALGSFALDAAQRAQREQVSATQLAFAHAVAGQIDIALISTTNVIRAIAAQPGLQEHVSAGDREQTLAY